MSSDEERDKSILHSPALSHPAPDVSVRQAENRHDSGADTEQRTNGTDTLPCIDRALAVDRLARRQCPARCGYALSGSGKDRDARAWSQSAVACEPWTRR
jgi:hypothetical protein